MFQLLWPFDVFVFDIFSSGLIVQTIWASQYQETSGLHIYRVSFHPPLRFRSKRLLAESRCFEKIEQKPIFFVSSQQKHESAETIFFPRPGNCEELRSDHFSIEITTLIRNAGTWRDRYFILVPPAPILPRSRYPMASFDHLNGRGSV